MRYFHSDNPFPCLSCNKNIKNYGKVIEYQNQFYCSETCLISFIFNNCITYSKLVYAVEEDAE